MSQHAIEGFTGRRGLPALRLRDSSGAQADIYLNGGHVTSWVNPAGEEMLFVSDSSRWQQGQPIRGGIPLVFPQFGPGPLPQHGFARTSQWKVVDDSREAGVRLRLESSSETLADWPHRFAAEVLVGLSGESLDVCLEITNEDESPFTFQAALHTYFRVADISRVSLEGLRGVTFVDSLRERAREVEQRQQVRFDRETDRVYVRAPDLLTLRDHAGHRAVTIRKENMPDVVVWNPWIGKSRRMEDFGDDEFTGMVCVETGAVENTVTLQPGETYEGRTVLTSVVAP